MRILVCEDSVLLREGLVRLLQHAGHEVVAALPDASQVLESVIAAEPDLAILDVRLPPTFTDEGIRAALELRRTHPELPLLVLSQYVEERYASDLIASGSTAFGYLLKDRVADVRDFLESLHTVAAGGSVLDPEVVSQLLTRRQSDIRMQRLTNRERAVLAALAEGKSNQAIAALLYVSEATVEKHITSIFTKLDLPNDESGNRRVLAAIAHLENSSPPASSSEPTSQGPQQ